MTLAEILPRLDRVAASAAEMSVEDLETLARAHTELLALSESPAAGRALRDALLEAGRHLEAIILRDLSLAEGMPRFRALLGAAREKLQDQVRAESAVEATSGDDGGQYLTFSLGPEEYGLSLRWVREILGRSEITRVPRTPAHIRGVINLRGRIIPVTDLRCRLGLTPLEDRPETCIVVVEVGGRQIGVLVDCVPAVVDIPTCDIEPPPSFDVTADTGFVCGLARVRGRITALLDVGRLLAGEPEAPDNRAIA